MLNLGLLPVEQQLLLLLVLVRLSRMDLGRLMVLLALLPYDALLQRLLLLLLLARLAADMCPSSEPHSLAAIK